MSKIAFVLALLAVMAVIACGGSLTVEEYAEECGEVLEDLQDAGYSVFGLDPSDIYYNYDPDDIEDFRDELDDVKDVIGQYKSLSPPSELADFHDARVESLSFWEGEIIPLIEDSLSLGEDLYDAYEDDDGDRIDDIRDDLDDLQDDYYDLMDENEDIADDLEDAIDDLSSRDRRDLERDDCL